MCWLLSLFWGSGWRVVPNDACTRIVYSQCGCEPSPVYLTSSPFGVTKVAAHQEDEIATAGPHTGVGAVALRPQWCAITVLVVRAPVENLPADSCGSCLCVRPRSHGVCVRLFHHRKESLAHPCERESTASQTLDVPPSSKGSSVWAMRCR